MGEARVGRPRGNAGSPAETGATECTRAGGSVLGPKAGPLQRMNEGHREGMRDCENQVGTQNHTRVVTGFFSSAQLCGTERR